jgi:hypothetical protein
VDPKLEPIHRELCDELHAEVGARVAAGRPARVTATTTPSVAYGAPAAGVVQLPRLTSTIENVLRSLIDFAAVNLGPTIEADATAYRDQIRQVLGEPTLEVFAEVIRRLKDANPQAGGA